MARHAVLAAIVLMLCVVLAHAALLPSGQWEGDEYLNLTNYREHGLAFLRKRALGWGPRPFSEALIYLYAWAVARLGQPLVTPALASAWALLIGFAAFGFAPYAKAARWRVLVVLSVIVAVLLDHPIGEMFYWPMGALAYLPALGGIACVTFLSAQDASTAPTRPLACMLALLVTACSAEVGALFVLCFCGLTGLFDLSDLRRGGTTRRLLRLVSWTVPLVVAGTVLLLLSFGRVAKNQELTAGASNHQLFPSLSGGFTAVLAELGAPDALGVGSWVWVLVTGAGLACCLRQCEIGAPSPRRLLALIVSAGLAAYGSAASAYFQFGSLCCERHQSFRAGLLVLCGVALAALAAGRGRQVWEKVPVLCGPALLALAVLGGSVSRAPALLADYRQMPARVRIEEANEASGRQPGPSMVLEITPPPRVVNDNTLPVSGLFKDSPALPWFVAGVLRFYGKQEVNITRSR